ncbi:hypothetical protein [Edaphobacillus lindanitolerans]|uniref:Uncharacterized protein n=1 Tax=Edaphobacillus lindanitolerans TaxID=550447 RepID=A0A1U7PL11_9BACI|nr:hypothetical protein [Edaphobacillus lindanitolerans]SIT73496.1 hypothetical protein SAMN05428946_0993 [Edaphobacillus lindanitolerans]
MITRIVTVNGTWSNNTVAPHLNNAGLISLHRLSRSIVTGCSLEQSMVRPLLFSFGNTPGMGGTVDGDDNAAAGRDGDDDGAPAFLNQLIKFRSISILGFSAAFVNLLSTISYSPSCGIG